MPELELAGERVIPANLKAVIDGDQSGFVLKVGHMLELRHQLMGFFPAILKSDNSRVILVFEIELLKRIGETLPSRPFKVNSGVFYVNDTLGVAYPVSDVCMGGPLPFLTTEEFEQHISSDPEPYMWAPGLIGSSMNHDEYERALEALVAQHS